MDSPITIEGVEEIETVDDDIDNFEGFSETQRRFGAYDVDQSLQWKIVLSFIGEEKCETFLYDVAEKIDEEDESVGGHFSNYCFGFTIDILH